MTASIVTGVSSVFMMSYVVSLSQGAGTIWRHQKAPDYRLQFEQFRVSDVTRLHSGHYSMLINDFLACTYSVRVRNKNQAIIWCFDVDYLFWNIDLKKLKEEL